MHTIGPNYILFSNILATAFIFLLLFSFFFKTGSLYLDKHAYFLGIPVYTPSEKMSAQVEYPEEDWSHRSGPDQLSL